MAQAKRKKKAQSEFKIPFTRGMREAVLFLLSAVAVYLFVSLVSYDVADPGWSHSQSSTNIHNIGGVVGAWFADISLHLFGYLAYLLPVLLGYWGWVIVRNAKTMLNPDHEEHHPALRGIALVVGIGSVCGLIAMHVAQPVVPMPTHAGGIMGDVLAGEMVSLISLLGATLLFLALGLAGFTLFTGMSWFHLMDATGDFTLRLLSYAQDFLVGQWDRIVGAYARRKRETVVEKKQVIIAKRKAPRIEPSVKKVAPSARVERERQVTMFESPDSGDLPALSLLDSPPEHKSSYSEAALEAMSRQVELKLADFGVEVEVVAVQPGPVITRFELQPAPGVKVSRISNLSKDMARALSVLGVRVVEVIPGKSVIGLEIPNENREMVTLGEILKSEVFDQATSPLTLAMGKGVAGEAIVVDLAKMPHLLVAGTTGSGKSVAVNAMILSILFKASPKEVRMIMIDPKMLELSVYEGIPHLLTEVVTDMKDAANALRWCVVQMDHRYRLMAALGVRNIAGYNRKVNEAIEAGKPIKDPLFQPDPNGDGTDEASDLQTLPFIVVVIDELADMMMIVGKKVEELIARLAQKARASGIHLVLATQRPSVDVITGLIKANIPSRISFQVSSRIDSRTILDQMGAESLLGQGDMLYLPTGSNLLTRIHGAFVDDHEVHAVVAKLRKQGKPDYIADIVQEIPELQAGGAGGSNDGESDPLYDQAVQIVLESRRASISGVQRRLKVGYNRAARMIETMEEAGVVSSVQSNGQREVIAPAPQGG